MLRAFNPHGKSNLTRGHKGTGCDFQAGALPQTPNAGQSQAIDWCSGHGVKPHLQIIFYTSTLLHGQTYDLQINPPMLCVSVTLCETPLPACGWRVRSGSETVVKRHFASRRSFGIVGVS